MRIMPLLEMLSELRFEARISADVAHGSHLQARHIALLRRVQDEVYHSFEWPWLNITVPATLTAGQRYLAYPAGLDQEGTDRVFARDPSGNWQKLTYGIGADELNLHDSDANVRKDTILRWQNYTTPEADPVNTNMLEVWPLPDRAVDMRFEGKRALAPLVDPNTDRSTVDGMVVVLHAAAEILAGQKADDAPLKLQKAQERHRLLKLRQARGVPRVNLV